MTPYQSFLYQYNNQDKYMYRAILCILLYMCSSLQAQTIDPIEKEFGYAISQIASSLSKYEYLSDANVIYQLANRNTLLASDVLSQKLFLLKGEITSVSFNEIFGGYTINIQPNNSEMLIQSYRNDKDARTDAKKVIVGNSYYVLFFVTDYKNDALIGESLVVGKTIREVAKEFVKLFPNEIRENECDMCLSNLVHGLVSIINTKNNTLKDEFGVSGAVDQEYYTDSSQNRKIIFKGTINDRYEIVMQITVDGHSISGSYYYTQNGSDNVLGLSGYLSNEKMKLTEYNEKGDNTGSFDGTFDAICYSGTFTNYKGIKMPFKLYHD